VSDLVDQNGWDFWGKEPDPDDLESDMTRADLPESDLPASDQAELETEKQYKTLTARLVDRSALSTIPSPELLLGNMLYRDSIAWIYGKPGHGKSIIALDFACYIATGTPWHGTPTKQGKVLYIVAEGASGMEQRVDAWEFGNVQEVPDDGWLTFLPCAVQLLTHSQASALSRIAKDLEADFIVIDTQARCTVGFEENSAKDMGRFVDALEKLRESTRACVLTVHHLGRAGENMRGSSSLDGAATTTMRATKEGLNLRLDCTKQKDADEFDPILSRLIVSGMSVYWSHDGLGHLAWSTADQDKIVGTLRDTFGTLGASTTNLIEATGLAKMTYYRAVKALVDQGILANLGSKARPRWVLKAGDDS
jgi:hypothetical protein